MPTVTTIAETIARREQLLSRIAEVGAQIREHRAGLRRRVDQRGAES